MLNVSLLGGFTLSPGDSFEIIKLDGMLTAHFNGLGEGALVDTFNDLDLFITYFGGDGNDIVLFTPEVTVLAELLIDSPHDAIAIVGNVEIATGAEVDVTPGYAQASATLETILAVTHTGTLDGLFVNEGDHLRDGIFVDAIHYNASDITVDILQAASGDINGDRLVDADDIQLIRAANSFGNPAGGPGPGGEWFWEQGDNNGDGLVDAIDIQNILATNLFGKPAYVALPGSAAAVPEPSTVILAFLTIVGLVACGHRRRRT